MFLKLVGAAKTRSQAARMVDNGRIRLVGYGGNLKNSHEVTPGERYEEDKATGMDVFEVVAVPPGNSLSKKDRPLYVKHTTRES